MWTQLPYLLQVQVSLTLMWLFYRLALQRDNRLVYARFFLLASVPVSLLLPLLVIPVFPGKEIALPLSLLTLSNVTVDAASAAEPAAAGPGFGFLLPLAAAAGSAALGFVTLLNALPWLRMMRVQACPVPGYGRLRVVYTPAVETACALFGCVFVNRERLKDDKDLYPVLAHEMAHVRLRHSWDLVMAETFRILFWWNPFVWLWYRSLREVHEFQADRAVLEEGYETDRYIGLIVSQFSDPAPAFVNGFSYSLIKKRILMIATAKPCRRISLKALLTIPLLGVLMTLFSFTERKAVLVFPEIDEAFFAELPVASMIPALPDAPEAGLAEEHVIEPAPEPPVEAASPENAYRELLADTVRLREHIRQAREAVARLREDSARLLEMQRQAMLAAEEVRRQADVLGELALRRQ